MRNICDMEQQNMSPAEVSRTSRTGETAHRALLIYLSRFLLTATNKNGSQMTAKWLRCLKEKEPPLFPHLAVCHHLAGDISKLGNSPFSHPFPTPESKGTTPHLATRSQVLGGKWSPLFHDILPLPVISSYLVFKLLQALTICYNWITDGSHVTPLQLISGTVCWFFWWWDLTSFLVLIRATEPLGAGESPTVEVWALPAACAEVAAPPRF